MVWLVNTAVSIQETCFRGPSATEHGIVAVGCLTEVESVKLQLMGEATTSTATYTTATILLRIYRLVYVVLRWPFMAPRPPQSI